LQKQTLSHDSDYECKRLYQKGFCVDEVDAARSRLKAGAHLCRQDAGAHLVSCLYQKGFVLMKPMQRGAG